MAVTMQQIITITKVAAIAIDVIVETYRFINTNKDKYRGFFLTVLNIMDSLEIPDSPLSGKEKKEIALVKIKEIAADNLFNWDTIKDVVSGLINDAKRIYNQMLDTKDSILNTLKANPI